MTRRVEVKEGQSFRDRTGLAVKVERIDANNRIHFSVIDYREGTSAGPGEMSDFAFVNALQESINALTEELRKAPDVGNIPPRSGVTHARCRFQSPR